MTPHAGNILVLGEDLEGGLGRPGLLLSCTPVSLYFSIFSALLRPLLASHCFLSQLKPLCDLTQGEVFMFSALSLISLCNLTWLPYTLVAPQGSFRRLELCQEAWLT